MWLLVYIDYSCLPQIQWYVWRTAMHNQEAIIHMVVQLDKNMMARG